jgi:hypothetical protein
MLFQSKREKLMLNTNFFPNNSNIFLIENDYWTLAIKGHSENNKKIFNQIIDMELNHEITEEYQQLIPLCSYLIEQYDCLVVPYAKTKVLPCIRSAVNSPSFVFCISISPTYSVSNRPSVKTTTIAGSTILPIIVCVSA